MERSDVAVWLLARQLFRSEDSERFWSNGLHAEHLQRDGHRVISLQEKAAYYDRALEMMRSRGKRAQQERD